jgi:amidohydrolase
MRTPQKLYAAVEQQLVANEAALIGWRRDFHQNPELGNRETRTSGIVAEHLKRLGLNVKTGVAIPVWLVCSKVGAPGPLSECAPTWTRCR